MSVRISYRVSDSALPTNLLTTADFTYDGFFIPDNSGSRFNFSLGLLSGRRYTDMHGTNTLRLLISGPFTDYAVLEISEPGVGTSKTTGVAGAPTASIYRNWTNVFAGKTQCELTFDGCASGTAKFSGLGYVGDAYGHGTQLLATYISNYQVNAGDPSLMSVTLLDDETSTCFGPWIADVLCQKFAGSIGLIPDPAWIAATGSGKCFIHNPVEGNQGSATRGANIIAFDPPANSTPPYTPTNLPPVTPTFTTKVALMYDATHPQARNTNFVLETQRADEGYAAAAAANPSWTAGLPFFNQGSGANVAYIGFDWTNAACWIKTTNKTGVIFIAQQTETLAGMDYSGAPGDRFAGPGQASWQYGAAFTQETTCDITASTRTFTVAGGDFPLWGFQIGDLVTIRNETIHAELVPVPTLTGVTATTVTISSGSLWGGTTPLADATGADVKFIPSPAQNCNGTVYIPNSASTGPQSTTVIRRLYGFDPAGMVAIANGGAAADSLPASWDLIASSFAGDWGTGLGYFHTPSDLVTVIRDIGGMYYDDVSQKLYVSQPYAIGDTAPVIHRFSLVSP